MGNNTGETSEPKGTQYFVRECKNFRKYLNSSLTCPAPKSAGRDFSTPKTPYEWRLMAMLMADFHMTRSEALDTTIVEASGLWAANSERLRKAEFHAADKQTLSLIDRAIGHQRQKDKIKFGVN